MQATTYPLNARKTELVLSDCVAVGAGAANLTIPTSSTGRVIATGTRTGAGVFDLVFTPRWKSPAGFPQQPGIVGTTAGLVGQFTAWNPAAGTATVRFTVGSTPTDPATTDTIYFVFWLRNSGRNA